MWLLTFLFISSKCFQYIDMVKVQVAEGWLEGEQLDLSTGDGQYYSFKGIPYAAPPLGQLRFKAPQPTLPWEGVRQAIDHGPICIQKFDVTGVPLSGNEDCLYLNVYTQDLKPKIPLSVLVFFHGGLYKSGSGNVENFGPDFLVKHGVVLVTINFRLEVLGFLCLDTQEVPGNAGMKDQVAALKWVQQNIANFGGDPDNVSLIGHSVGAVSAALHMISPMSKNLFNRAILMSGSPFCDWTIPFEPKRRAFALGKQLGSETNDPIELLEFLQNVPADYLAGTNPCLSGSEIQMSKDMNKINHFTPVVEKDFGQDRFIIGDPKEMFENGKASDIDILIGFTNLEPLSQIRHIESITSDYNTYPEMIVPRKLFLKSTPSEIMKFSDLIREEYFGQKPITTKTMKEIINYIYDSSFVYDILTFLKLISNAGCSKRYLYRFSGVSERNVHGDLGAKYGLSGASHMDDLMYLFDAKKTNLTIEKPGKGYKMIQLMCSLFTNFAKYGDPTPDSCLGAVWMEYNNINQNYMDISETLTPWSMLKADSIAFWQKIYEIVNEK